MASRRRGLPCRRWRRAPRSRGNQEEEHAAEGAGLFPRPSGCTVIFFRIPHRNPTSPGFFKARCNLGPEATMMTPGVPVPGKPTGAEDQETGRGEQCGAGDQSRKRTRTDPSSNLPQRPSLAPGGVVNAWEAEVLAGGGLGARPLPLRFVHTSESLQNGRVIIGEAPRVRLLIPGASFPKFCFLLRSSKEIGEPPAPPTPAAFPGGEGTLRSASTGGEYLSAAATDHRQPLPPPTPRSSPAGPPLTWDR